MASVATVSLPGCGGCRRTPAQTQAEKEKAEKEKKEKEDKEKKKPKPDFEFAKLQTLPGDDTYAVKPGHWMAVSQQMKTNNFNFNGDLMSAAVDTNLRALNLEHMPYRLEMLRPASLPKGQAKHMEMTVFIPRRQGERSSRATILSRLMARGGGRTVREEPNPTTTMEDFQYYFIALARQPERYGFLKVIDALQPPRGDWSGKSYQHYRVVLPQADKYVPLPSNPLMWTCIAYVLWDDIDPDWLSLDQQDALIDWLHWGGQLIISGPGSLETLKASFLAPYLPALPEKTIALPQARFDEINARFALPGKGGAALPLTIVDTKPPEGVELKLYGDGQFVPHTGELLAERSVGRGRIAVSSLALDHPQFTTWKNFDGFFNTCVLRRPARRFSSPEGGAAGVKADWRNSELSGRMTDPRMVSNVRYFTRDMGYLHSIKEKPLRDPAEVVEFGVVDTSNRYELEKVDETAMIDAAEQAWDLSNPPLLDRGFRAAAQSGVAGWNDASGASHAARQSLKEAAGISVPKRDFVLRILAVYLLVLVPVNWAVFWAIGRVEWAWVAAPIIAICGAFAVVRLAQLDIGFARSRTEVAILELQGSHPRGHLTRYVALYTSLSTRYNVNFDDPNALAQPLGDPEFEKLSGQSSSTVSFTRDRNVGLRGFLVQSNSTGMLHTEEMRHIGGAIVLQSEPQGLVVINKSTLPLRDVGIVRRLPNGEAQGAEAIEVAWIGELEPQKNRKVVFVRVTDARALLREWQKSPVTSTRRAEGEVSLLRLLDLARDPRRMFPGDMKLIGWTDADLGGIEFRPRPSQSTLRTLVIANLEYSPPAPPVPDENTRLAVAAIDDGGGIEADTPDANGNP
jgi:hypothetical protein